MKNLTQADRDRIAAAVLEAEKLTTGEIVPMIVAQSDDYPGARWRLAIVTALLFGFITYFFLGDFDPAWILWAQLPGLYVGYGLGNFGPAQGSFDTSFSGLRPRSSFGRFSILRAVASSSFSRSLNTSRLMT